MIFLSDNSQCSAQRSDLISSSSSLSGETWRNWDSIQKNNVSKMLQETYLQSSLRNYALVHRGQTALNSKDAHTKCWFNLVNRSYLIQKIYLWDYFWQHPHVTAFLHKCLKLFTVLLLCRVFLEASWRHCHSSSELLQLMTKWIFSNLNRYFLLTHCSKI